MPRTCTRPSCARLEPVPDSNITSEWQRCDLFPDHGSTTKVDIADGGEPVVVDTVGLQRLLEALRALGMTHRLPAHTDDGTVNLRSCVLLTA